MTDDHARDKDQRRSRTVRKIKIIASIVAMLVSGWLGAEIDDEFDDATVIVNDDCEIDD